MHQNSKIQSSARALFINDLPVVPGAAFFLVISAVLITISLINPNAFSSLRVSVSDNAAPVLSAVRQPFDGLSDMVRNTTGLAALQAENIKLQSENERLREWYQRALALQVENKALQSLLNVNVAPEHKFVTARILSDTSTAYAKTILITGGEEQKIKSGQPVTSGEGVLGRVVEHGNNTSRVLLLNDLNSRIPVVLDASNTHAIMAGTNSDLPILTHLPKDTMLKEGDRLLTSGLGGMYPPGLPVGVIARVVDGKPHVMPYADIDRIHFVRVIQMSEEHPNLRLASE